MVALHLRSLYLSKAPFDHFYIYTEGNKLKSSDDLPNRSSLFPQKQIGAAFVGTKRCEIIFCTRIGSRGVAMSTCPCSCVVLSHQMSMLREQPLVGVGAVLIQEFQCSTVQYSYPCLRAEFTLQHRWNYHKHDGSVPYPVMTR